MTSVDVNDVLKRTQSTANGSTTDFSFSFQVNATSEIKVYEDSTLKTEGTHYDVVNSSGSVGLNTDGTGIVKFKTSPSDYTPANTKVITILSVMSLARSSVYSSGGNITAQSLETDFDGLHRIAGDFKEVKSRTLIAPEYSPTTIDMTIPSKASRLGKILSFNASTGNPEVTFTVADGLTLASVSADIATLADIEDGTDATNAIQTVASNASNVNTVAGISSNVTTVAGIQANVTTVAGKASLITSDFAADMALIDSTFVSKMNLVTSDFVSDVNTLATSDIISDINLLATTDVISDLNTLATSDIVSDLNTLATSDIVSDINTLATSDIVSDLNTLATSDIVSDINTLATSDIVADLALLATSDFVSDLNTMATSTNVSDLNTVAGAVTNVNNVGGSIANVNTVASNLSGVNSFADRYRVASSAPSSSLDVGDLYFDTTANELKVYKSSGWAAAGSTVNGTSARFHYDISGTPTTVTGADAAGNTLAYDAGFVDVYVNGVRMSPEDITVTSGTSVVFGSALADGDDVDIVAFGTFSVANIVSTGALNTGSITSGFGNIDTGSSTITTTGAISGGTLTGSTSIKTPLIEFTDGDNALTIADGGHVTANANLTVSGTTTINDDLTLTGANYNVTWDKSDNALEFGDNAKATFGAGNDLQIYHTPGTGSFIDEADDGSLFIRSSRVTIHKYTGETMINAVADGAVSLYYDDAKKLETTPNGIGVEAGATYSHNTNFKGMDVGDQAFYGEYDGGSLYIVKNRYFDGSNWIAKENGGGSAVNMDTSGDIHFQTSANVNAGQTGGLTTRATVKESNGLMYIPNAYSVTTGTGANMYIQSDGAFYRSTSSRRYKNTIEDATHGLAELLKLRSVTYKGNNDGDIILGGLIAEEVHDAGLTEFVQYNDDDEPDALSYGNMVSLCIKAIQEQQEQIKTLETKVKALEEA